MKGFGSDNHAGVHPELLRSMLAVNADHAPSYGTDPISLEAELAFNKIFGQKVKTFFVYNGTSANALAMRAMVKPWQSVLCTDTSHLNVDECGAPEFLSGAKLQALPSVNGKLTLETLKGALIRRGDQHYSQAKVVSITQPTELGTCYSIQEIKDIVTWAHKEGLLVHIDGARIANAVIHLNTSFKELLTDTGIDVLSFGGTKNGLMMGEAVVFFNLPLAQDFIYIRKQMGQLPSKTRFISAQFLTYLENNIWKEIATHTTSLARYLGELVQNIPGVEVTQPIQSNGVFAKIPREWTKSLREKYFFYIWDEKTFECRWMISFDTTRAEIEDFAEELKKLSQAKK
jgi:threonine aldolase